MSRNGNDSRVANRFIIWIFYDADFALQNMVSITSYECKLLISAVIAPILNTWVMNEPLNDSIVDQNERSIKLYVEFNGYFSFWIIYFDRSRCTWPLMSKDGTAMSVPDRICPVWPIKEKLCLQPIDFHSMCTPSTWPNIQFFEFWNFGVELKPIQPHIPIFFWTLLH